MKELERLEEEKIKLINEYMKYQDVVDSYNEKIYKVCSEIEILNIKIRTLKKRDAKKKNHLTDSGLIANKKNGKVS